MGALENFEAMLAKGQDNVLLRFGLGNEYLKQERFDDAVTHLREAVNQDAGYSAAWKLLGKALTGAGDVQAAKDAYRQGVAAAETKGDKQAAKEMNVFLKRLEKADSAS
jgi:predicted Zn-dependent protease